MSELGMPESPMFKEPTPGREFPVAAVAIAAVAVAILVGVLVVLGKKHEAQRAPNTVQPLAAYASSLEMSGIKLSEASSMSGGKSTYIDGHVANHGTATVTGITVQVIFANDQAMPPQLETTSLPVVYMHEPYIDTRPVKAAPIGPGEEADFRLIFDGVNDNWNQRQPEIRVIGVTTRDSVR